MRRFTMLVMFALAGVAFAAPDGSMHGVVLCCTDQSPVAGATVEWRLPGGIMDATVADASGRFRIDGLPAGWLCFSAHAPGLYPDPSPPLVRVAAGRVTPCTVYVEPGYRINLKVVLEGAGEPVPRAFVEIRCNDPKDSTTVVWTPESPELPRLPRTKRYGLTITAPGYWSNTTQGYYLRTPEQPDGVVEHTLGMFRNPRGPVQVVDSAGRPVAGARVRWMERASDLFPTPEWTTSATGFAEVEGTGIFEVEREGYASTLEWISLNAKQARRITLYRPATLVGRVLHADGSPAPDARLELVPKTSWRTYDPIPVPVDAQGRWRLEGASAGVKYRPCAEAAGERVEATEEITPEEGQAKTAPDLVLEHQPLFSGRVVDDETGGGIPGIVLTLDVNRRDNPPPATTDAEGRFSFGNVPLRARLRLSLALGPSAPRDDYLFPELDDEHLLADRTDYEIRLRRGVVLTGEVVSADDGRPLGDAWVRAEPHEMDREAQRRLNWRHREVGTNEDGRFSLVLQREMVSFRLRSSRTGYRDAASEPMRLVAGEELDPVRIELLPGLSITGLVLDEAGDPVVWSHVCWRRIDGNVGRPVDGKVDGAFEITDLPPGRYRLFADREERGAEERLERDRKRPDPLAVEVALDADRPVPPIAVRIPSMAEQTGVLAGRVVDAAGHPLAGAYIQIVGGFRITAKATVGVDGSFEIGNLPAGMHALYIYDAVSRANYLGSLCAEAPSRDLLIHLRETGAIAGHIAETGWSDKQDARVKLQPAPGTEGELHSAQWPTVGLDGAFSFEKVLPGRYVVALDVGGYLPFASEPFEVQSGRTAEGVTIEWPGEGTVELRVLDAEGQPRPRVSVRLAKPYSPEPQRMGTFYDNTWYFGETDGRGVAVFERILAGHHLLPLHAGDDFGSLDLDIPRGGKVQVTFSPAGTGWIEGTAHDPAGRSFDEAWVRAVSAAQVDYVRTRVGDGSPAFDLLRDPEATDRAAWKTAAHRSDYHGAVDAGGAYRIEHVPPGRYALCFFPGRRHASPFPNYGSAVAPRQAPVVVVQAGQGTRFDFDIPSGSIFVQVAGATEAYRVCDGRISLWSRTGWRVLRNGGIDKRGWFSARELAAGRYRVEVITEAGAGTARDVELATGEEKRVDLTVPGIDVEGVVLSSLSSQPIAYAHVTLASGDTSLSADPDAKGRFVFAGIPDGTYTLSARAHGHVDASRPLVVAGGRLTGEATLLLPPWARVRCRVEVQGAGTGMPWVCAVNEQGDAQREPVVSLEGFTEMTLPPGDWRLRVAGGGIVSDVAALTLEPGRTRAETFTCLPAVSLALHAGDVKADDVCVDIRSCTAPSLPLEWLVREPLHYELAPEIYEATVVIRGSTGAPRVLRLDLAAHFPGDFVKRGLP